MKNLLSTFIFKSVDPLKRTDSNVWFIWESDYTDRAHLCSLESLAVLWREWIMQETLSKYFSMVFWLPQEKTACVRTLNRNKHSVSVLIFFKWKIFHSLFLFKIWHLSQPSVKPVLSAWAQSDYMFKLKTTILFFHFISDGIFNFS